MRKIFLACFLLLFASFLLVAFSFAQSTNTYTPTFPVKTSIGGTNFNFLGQDQYYTVTFRGNGEAVVGSKIIFSNTSDATISSMILRVPKVNPQDIIVYQVTRESECIRYKPMPLPMPPTKMPGLPQSNIPQDNQVSLNYSSICEEYQIPDYYQNLGSGNKYQKAKYEYKGDTLVVELPEGISPNSSGSFILYYRASGYAKKNIIGKYNFVFETLKVNDKIRWLYVGITTDSDLYLRGSQGKVNYRFSEAMSNLKTESAGQAVSSPVIDDYYQQIGQGEVIKTASNLQPLDSYSVVGSYADSQWKLYGKEISVVIVITLIILLIAFKIIKSLLKVFKNKPVVGEHKEGHILGLLGVLGLSFVSSLFILGYTFFLFFFNQISENFSSYYNVSFLITIFLIIISIGFYAILLLGPALIVGIKKGLTWGISTFVLTIFWLIFYFLIIFAVLFLLYHQESPPILMNTESPPTLQSPGMK